MPDPRPLTGLFGKVPAHGDFVRRGLPTSFVAPWDTWLQAGMSQARAGLGADWDAAWDDAPAWRFALPAGACGPDAVAGVMLPSADTVGRRFPITLAVLLAPGASMPGEAWFAALEGAALAGRAGQADADALAAAIPPPDDPAPVAVFPIPLAETALPAPGLPGGGAGEDGDPADPWGAPDPTTDTAVGIAAHDPDSVGEIDLLAAFSGQASRPAEPEGTLAGLIGQETAVPEPLPGGDSFAAFLEGMDAGATPADTTVEEPVTGQGAQGEQTAGDDPLLTFMGSGTDTQAAMRHDGPIDPLAALIGDAGATTQPGWCRDSGPDPLATLIGDGEGDGATPLPSWSGTDGSDPLGLLMGSAAEPARGEEAPPEDRLTAPSVPEETVLDGFVSGVPTGPGASAMEPSPPEAGGWWTRGGAQVPPMVWARPGLPSSDEFAYLLKAEA